MEVIRKKEEVFRFLEYDRVYMKMEPDINILFRLLMPIASRAEAKVENDALCGVVLYFDNQYHIEICTESIEWNERNGLVGRAESLLLTLFRVMTTHHEKQLLKHSEEISKLLQTWSRPVIFQLPKEKE